MSRYGLFVRSADDFIADAIDLDLPKALIVIEGMRQRFEKPELTREELVHRLQAVELIATADLLRPPSACLS